MTLIFRGVGGKPAPHTPEIDLLMSKRLVDRGYRGKRGGKGVIFGSTRKEQALTFATDGNESHLRIVQPEPGSLISIPTGLDDMILEFGVHLREMHWQGLHGYKGTNFATLSRDIAGDVDIMETYLHFGRQKKAIGAMIDRFLDTVEITEHEVNDETDIPEILADHRGELWITGPCRVMEYTPDLEYGLSAGARP